LARAEFTEIGAALRLCHAENEHESGTFSRSTGKYGRLGRCRSRRREFAG
jgi:hypothetical protein